MELPYIKRTMFEELTSVTIKISTLKSNGKGGSGTGFFFHFPINDDDHGFPVIVTNKHVVKDASAGQLLFTAVGEDGEPIHTKHIVVSINNFDNCWIKHPDENIDLCILPLAPILKSQLAKKELVHVIKLMPKLFPSAKQLANLDALENVVMVGYPNGFSDTINNKPIFRRGITATDIRFDYCGKNEFLIDAAVFPGSSGSPVFIADQGSYVERGSTVIGSRLFFIGVVYATFQNTIEGKIIQQPIETMDLSVRSFMPNHLGLVIRYDRLMDFAPILLRSSGLGS